MAGIFSGSFRFHSIQTVPATWPMRLTCAYEIKDSVRPGMLEAGMVTVDVSGPSQTWGQTLTAIRAAITAKDGV